MKNKIPHFKLTTADLSDVDHNELLRLVRSLPKPEQSLNNVPYQIDGKPVQHPPDVGPSVNAVYARQAGIEPNQLNWSFGRTSR
jgi:hypothetical protein